MNYSAGQAQGQLQAFTIFFENNPAAMAICRKDTFIEINHAFLGKLGYSRDEVVGKAVIELGNIVDVAKYQQAMQELEANGRIKDIELQVRHQNGKIIHGLFSGDIIEYQGEKSFLTVMIDITDYIQEREKNQELERIFTVNPDLLCVVDFNTNVIKRNSAWTAVLGYSPEEIQRLKFMELLHSEDKVATLAAMDELRKQKQAVVFVNRYRHQDRSYRYMEWHAYLHETVLFIAGRDITARLKQEEELRANLKIKEAHLELTQLQNVSTSELLDKSLEHVIILTGSQLGFIFLYDAEKQEFLLHSWSEAVQQECAVKDQQRLYSLGHVGLWGEAVRQRKAIVINDYSSTEVKKHGYPEGHIPIKKFLSIPVIDREKIVAVVGVANKETDYTEEDIFNLQMLMNRIWMQVERTKNEEMLKREQTLFGAALFSIYEGIIATDQEGKILVMNPIAEKLTGCSTEEVYGEEFAKVVKFYHAVTKEKIADPVKRVLEAGQPEVAPPDVMLLAKNGVQYHIAGNCAPAIALTGKIVGTVVNFRDITTAWQKQKKDEYVSHHDALTGAYNRLFFEQKIVEVMDCSDRYGESLSMLLLDLDHFKRVNDTWGHPAGDAVLKQTAEMINKIIRSTDLLVRLGGEEFIVLMPQVNIRGAMVVAEKIRTVLDNHVHAVAGKVTASFGVAERKKTESFADWYKRVDEALYHAKTSGRNRVVSAEYQERLPLASVLLEWRDEWKSGHSEIDEQHFELLECGNKLIYLSLSGAEMEAVVYQLDRILEHTVKHFAYEEQIMVQVGYSDYQRHVKIHETLVRKALALKEDYQQGKLKPAAFFSFIVDDIIVGHMLHDDVQFFPYIKKM